MQVLGFSLFPFPFLFKIASGYLICNLISLILKVRWMDFFYLFILPTTHIYFLLRI